MKIQMASCTNANNSHAETVKYSIKNAVSVILMSFKICTYYFAMLG